MWFGSRGIIGEVRMVQAWLHAAFRRVVSLLQPGDPGRTFSRLQQWHCVSQADFPEICYAVQYAPLFFGTAAPTAVVSAGTGSTGGGAVIHYDSRGPWSEGVEFEMPIRV